MNLYSCLGGRKMFAWQVITVISSIALFVSKLTSGEWVTITLTSYVLLEAANVSQKALAHLEIKPKSAYNKEEEKPKEFV